MVHLHYYLDNLKRSGGDPFTQNKQTIFDEFLSDMKDYILTTCIIISNLGK